MSELGLLERRAARFGLRVVRPEWDDGSRDYWLQNSSGGLVCGAEDLRCLDILLTESLRVIQ